jgi:hypothetical protein
MATYISNQTGNWSTASTWVTAAANTLSPTAAAGAAPQSGGGDKFIIRSGHTVTYDLSAGEFGDQTSTYVSTILTDVSANAICLSGGTLKASRSINTSLTARGTIYIGISGTLDWGTSTDPLTTSSTIILNYITNAAILSTSTGAAGIFLFGNTNSSNNIYINGIPKKRNTYLTSPVSSGSNIISVESTTGWLTGDKIIIQSEAISAVNNNPLFSSTSGLLSATVQGITGLNVQLSQPLNTNRSSGRAVSNFSGNVVITSYNKLYPSYGVYSYETNSIVDINNVVFRDIGWSSGWFKYGNGTVAGAVQANAANAAFTRNVNTQINSYSHKSIAVDQTTNINSHGITINGALPYYTNLDDIAVYITSSSTGMYSLNINYGLLSNITNCTFIKTAGGISAGSTNIKTVNVNNCIIDAYNMAVTNSVNNLYGFKLSFNNCKFRSGNYITGTGNCGLYFNSCYLEYKPTDGLVDFTDSAYSNVYFKQCTLNGGKLKSTPSNSVITTKDYSTWIYEPTVISNSLSSVNKYTRYNSYYYADSDFTIRKNGLNGYRIRPELSNTVFEVYETIPVVKGNNYRIKGNLRFDSNYGTANPPAISFVGTGINTTFTSSSTVNTWQSFDYTLSATTTEDIAVTITGQSTLTSGYVWLDGLPFFPMIQGVRWYGFNFDTNQYRTVNTLTTLTENQVSALAVVSNLDYLYDAANYWSITNPTSSSYIDLYTQNGNILDFGNKNITIDSSAGTGFAYNSGSNTITIKSTTLSAGNNFNDLKTTGTITLANGASIGGSLMIQGNVSQATPTNLTNVTILGLLSYNTNSPTSITYTNCAVTSATNTGSSNVTIKRINSTVSYV